MARVIEKIIDLSNISGRKQGEDLGIVVRSRDVNSVKFKFRFKEDINADNVSLNEDWEVSVHLHFNITGYRTESKANIIDGEAVYIFDTSVITRKEKVTISVFLKNKTLNEEYDADKFLIDVSLSASDISDNKPKRPEVGGAAIAYMPGDKLTDSRFEVRNVVDEYSREMVLQPSEYIFEENSELPIGTVNMKSEGVRSGLIAQTKVLIVDGVEMARAPMTEKAEIENTSPTIYEYGTAVNWGEWNQIYHEESPTPIQDVIRQSWVVENIEVYNIDIPVQMNENCQYLFVLDFEESESDYMTDNMETINGLSIDFKGRLYGYTHETHIRKWKSEYLVKVISSDEFNQRTDSGKAYVLDSEITTTSARIVFKKEVSVVNGFRNSEKAIPLKSIKIFEKKEV